MTRYLVSLLLCAGLLSGCAWFGDKDNAEPPAKLKDFEKQVQLRNLWSRDTGDGTNEQFVKLVPTVVGQRVYVADRNGSVRAYEKDGTCFVGRLIVHPDFQDRGIGSRLMEEIEKRFEDVERFRLFTGHLSHKPLHIYAKKGYIIFRTEPVHDNLTLVYLEKRRSEE